MVFSFLQGSLINHLLQKSKMSMTILTILMIIIVFVHKWFQINIWTQIKTETELMIE